MTGKMPIPRRKRGAMPMRLNENTHRSQAALSPAGNIRRAYRADRVTRGVKDIAWQHGWRTPIVISTYCVAIEMQRSIRPLVHRCGLYHRSLRGTGQHAGPPIGLLGSCFSDVQGSPGEKTHQQYCQFDQKPHKMSLCEMSLMSSSLKSIQVQSNLVSQFVNFTAAKAFSP